MASLRALAGLLHITLVALLLLSVSADVATHPALAPVAAGSHHHQHHHGHHHTTHPAQPPALAPNHTNTPVSTPKPHAPAPAPVAHAPAPSPKPNASAPPPMAHAPVHPPAATPVHPPAVAPVPAKAPAHPPVVPHVRSFLAVQGVVYCKPCKYVGVPTFLGATPLKGATVKVRCNNTKNPSKYPTEAKGTTDVNGYFLVTAPKTVTNFGAHRCQAVLVASPNANCSIPTNVNGGVSGGSLRYAKPFTMNNLPFSLYSTGPFAYDPKC